jgi:hypothetical protein
MDGKEKKVIESRAIGYFWEVNLSSGPASNRVELKLGGNEETYADAIQRIKSALDGMKADLEQYGEGDSTGHA